MSRRAPQGASLRVVATECAKLAELADKYDRCVTTPIGTRTTDEWMGDQIKNGNAYRTQLAIVAGIVRAARKVFP